MLSPPPIMYHPQQTIPSASSLLHACGNHLLKLHSDFSGSLPPPISFAPLFDAAAIGCSVNPLCRALDDSQRPFVM
jgi:hypothetical protein